MRFFATKFTYVRSLGLGYCLVSFLVQSSIAQTGVRRDSNTVDKESSGSKGTKGRLTEVEKEKNKARKIACDVIDILYLQRDPQKAFSTYSGFEKWDESDSDLLGYGSFLKGVPRDLGKDLSSRISTVIWDYAFQETYLTLGLYPIKRYREGDVIIDQPTEYRNLLSSVIRERNTPYPNLDFAGLSSSQIENRLAEIEGNYKVVDGLIETRINRKLYLENIEKIKTSIEVKRIIKGKRVYYAVEFLPSFILILRDTGNGFTIINLSGEIL